MVKLKSKVSLSSLWVSSHERLSDFYASSWQRGRSAVPLLVFRLILCLITLGILTWSIYESPTRYWLIYLTNWGLLFIACVTISGVLVSFMAVCRRINDEDGLPWYVSLYWFSTNIGFSLAIMITTLYWILLYNPEAETEGDGTRAFWLDIATHGLNSVIMFAELLASRTPVAILHMYQPLGMGLWYAAFSAIYYLAGGTDANENPFIYEVLDWRQSGQAGAVVAAATGGLIVIYLLLWGAALLRDWASTALLRTKSHDLPFVPSDNDLQTRIV